MAALLSGLLLKVSLPCRTEGEIPAGKSPPDQGAIRPANAASGSGEHLAVREPPLKTSSPGSPSPRPMEPQKRSPVQKASPDRERRDPSGLVAQFQTKGGQGASWVREYARLDNEIRVRHYSVRTLRNYRMWARAFQGFTKSKPPESLSPDDVKEFLTSLAVKKKVSSSEGVIGVIILLLSIRESRAPRPAWADCRHLPTKIRHLRTLGYQPVIGIGARGLPRIRRP